MRGPRTFSLVVEGLEALSGAGSEPVLLLYRLADHTPSCPVNSFTVRLKLVARSRWPPHLDLSISRANFQARLRMHSGPVQHSAILQRKPREVIRAHNGITLKFTF